MDLENYSGSETQAPSKLRTTEEWLAGWQEGTSTCRA
jgi:hypothetical protein